MRLWRVIHLPKREHYHHLLWSIDKQSVVFWKAVFLVRPVPGTHKFFHGFLSWPRSVFNAVTGKSTPFSFSWKICTLYALHFLGYDQDFEYRTTYIQICSKKWCIFNRQISNTIMQQVVNLLIELRHIEFWARIIPNCLINGHITVRLCVW
jgi:hypothetical protein